MPLSRLFPLKELFNAYFLTDEKQKEETLKTLRAEAVPFYMKKVEEIAERNNGHLALKKLTWADLYFVSLYYMFNAVSQQDMAANNPNLKKVIDNVLAIDNIKKWVENRPQTEV